MGDTAEQTSTEMRPLAAKLAVPARTNAVDDARRQELTMDLSKLDEAFTGQALTTADVVAAVVVFGIGIALALLVGRLLRRYFGRPGQQAQQMAKLAGRIGQWSIVGIAAAWALSILGLNIGGISVFIGFALLILALATKPIIESFAISIVIASRPAFGVGDEIVVGDVVGEVIEITQRSVVVRRRDGARVHIPNADVISENVTVLSTHAERRSSVDVQVAYDTDIDEAEQVIRAAAADVDGVTRVGSIQVTSISSCVEFSIRFWHESSIDAANETKDAVFRSVHRALRQSGVEGAPSLEVALVGHVLPGGTPLGLPGASNRQEA